MILGVSVYLPTVGVGPTEIVGDGILVITDVGVGVTGSGTTGIGGAMGSTLVGTAVGITDVPPVQFGNRKIAKRMLPTRHADTKVLSITASINCHQGKRASTLI